VPCRPTLHNCCIASSLRLHATWLYAAWLIISSLFAQVPAIAQEADKCGYDETLAKAQRFLLGDKWGYSYDSLLVDLQAWGQHPSVSIQSIGKSVQNRDIWELTITSPEPPVSGRRRVYIHARTHPNEVQSHWVTQAMIEFLLSEDPEARLMRSSLLFHIVPMYNPDGVELELPRENANGIDIESNWSTVPSQPEVTALRNRFMDLMWSPAPIEVALNMHSAFGCKRYFVYHDSVGSSNAYAVLQRSFIGGIQSFFPGGIEPWNYFVSWKTGTPTVYPESWFWLNYRESVMALTYEDMNCTSAGQYDLTASAILRGVVQHLGIGSTLVAERAAQAGSRILLGQAYPNPVSLGATGSSSAIVEFELPSSQNVRLALYDVLGRQIALIADGERPGGVSRAAIRLDRLSSGSYFYRLETVSGTVVRSLLVTH